MKITRLLLLAALVTAAGCDSEGRVRPPPVKVRIFNAAPNFENVSFRREQRLEAQLPFGSLSSHTFDADQYEFHLDFSVVGNSLPARGQSFTLNLSPDYEYLVVPVSPDSQLQGLVFATDPPATSTDPSRVTFVHAHPGIGELDVYFVNPATVTDCQVTGEPSRGSLSFGTTPVSFNVSPGDYRICLTAANDPAAVLYQSIVVPLQTAGLNFAFVTFDDGGLNATEINVSVMETSAVRLNPGDSEAQIRFIQGVDDGLDRNIFFDEATTPALPAPLSAGILTDYLPLPIQSTSMHLVPIGGGDPDTTVTLTPLTSAYYTLFFAGDTTDGISGAVLVEDKRSIVGQASVRFVHLAGMHDNVEIFLRAPGTDITSAIPNALFTSSPSGTAKLAYFPTDYEITIRDTDTQAILLGPEPLSLVDGGVYGFMILNDPTNPAAVKLEFLYDLAQ